jgi:ATP-dependent DNA ligase
MLPQVMPMLAVAAEPFDSPEYSFEIKWDGVRALAAVD